MKRSAITNNDNDNDNNKSSITTNELKNHQHKRSLEDYGFLKNFKRRRHLSPQNSNIDLNNDNDTTSLPSIKKKTRTKSKNQSILNSSIDTNNELNSTNDCQTTPRKTSSRNTSASLSFQQMNEINLPNWERMCPNIDQILSNKHTQSGVFAHEVQLVQQELEALLSMSIVRENILKDLSKLSTNHSDTIRSKIRKHQEAERIYSIKKLSKKPLPSVINHQHQQQQRQNGLDRQVTIAPVLAAKIDRIWSDITTYHHKISSNDILMIENLVEFNGHLKSKLEEFKTNYNTQQIQQATIIEQLNEENFHELNQITQLNPLVTHYVDRTTIGAFQSKLYEHIGQTSPVYKTPISSPMHGRMLSNNYESSLRISPRLHSNHKTGIFALPNLKYDEECDVFPSSSTSTSTSLAIKSKKKNKFLSSPTSAVKFQQRLEYVQNYLIDQHPTTNETVKRQLFNESKSMKKRKISTSINNDQCSDIFQSKLSTLISLVNECSTLSSLALRRAHLQLDNEQIWQKLNTIERDLETSIEKLDKINGHNNNSTTEKAFQNLDQLLNDWNKYEQEFDQQLDKLFHNDQ